MKYLLILFFGLSVRLALADKPEAADADYEPLIILTRHCAGCHQAADHPGALFLNRSRLSEKASLDLMIRLIETSQMPPAHAKFKKTADGKTLLKWLKEERARQKK